MVQVVHRRTVTPRMASRGTAANGRVDRSAVGCRRRVGHGARAAVPGSAGRSVGRRPRPRGERIQPPQPQHRRPCGGKWYAKSQSAHTAASGAWPGETRGQGQGGWPEPSPAPGPSRPRDPSYGQRTAAAKARAAAQARATAKIRAAAKARAARLRATHAGADRARAAAVGRAAQVKAAAARAGSRKPRAAKAIAEARAAQVKREQCPPGAPSPGGQQRQPTSRSAARVRHHRRYQTATARPASHSRAASGSARGCPTGRCGRRPRIA